MNTFRIFFLLFYALSCKPNVNETVEQAVVNEINIPVKSHIPKYSPDYLMGKFTPPGESNFVEIDQKYADRAGLFMHAEAYTAFKKMYDKAKESEVNLTIKSATRNFDYQKGIWERKWTGSTTLSDGTNAARDIKNDVDRALKILEYSSMPGTSRHHWGTDIDINAFNNRYFESGKGKIEYDWLLENAEEFGFGQPYTVKNSDRPTGYNEEKWHWSYLPLSSIMTQDAQHLLADPMIKGFHGDHTPEKIGIVEKYILGIHKSCKEWH